MKKVLFAILLIATFTLVMASAAFASGRDNYVFDETGTLTGFQIDALNEKAAAILQKRECAAYIWIVDLVPEEYARTYDGLEIYIDAFYKRNDLGYGGDRNGIVLLLEIGDVPGERDIDINTHGACKSVFSIGVIDRVLDDHLVPLFRDAFNNGNFYKVADVFLDRVESEFSNNFAATLAFKLAVVILVPLLIAIIVCSIWKAKMKTAKLARTADNYIPANGFNLTGRTDQFLYRTTTRTKIERESSSSGGSSGSSSSGRTGGRKI